MIYGYARVSTDGQSVAAQVAKVIAVGAEKVFLEVASGAKTDRVELSRALGKFDSGDVFVVTGLDRLVRSAHDLLNTLATIAERRAGCRSLSETWAATTKPHNRLMLTVLGGLAELERELIRTRTGEDCGRARASGQSLGRPHKLTIHQRKEAAHRKANGEAVREFARSYNVSAATILRLSA